MTSEFNPVTEYTEAGIQFLQETFDHHRTFANELISFLDPISRKLDFDGVSSVDVNNGEVNFIAFWDGPYQSHDQRCFSFPLSMLTQGQIEIASHLRKGMDDEQRKATEVSNARKEAEDRSIYERLRSKFESKE